MPVPNVMISEVDILMFEGSIDGSVVITTNSFLVEVFVVLIFAVLACSISGAISRTLLGASHSTLLYLRFIPRLLAEGASMVKFARIKASGKEGLRSVLPEHINALSVVAFGRIEQTKVSPSRLMTNGQQSVASPIVAESSGTGII